MLARLQAAAKAVGDALTVKQTPKQVIHLLVTEHRGSLNLRAWTNTLRVAGVTATCTWSQDEGLLEAWRKNATLRLMREHAS